VEDGVASTKARQLSDENTSIGPDEPILLSRTVRWPESALTSTQLFAWTVLYDDRLHREKRLGILLLKDCAMLINEWCAQFSTSPNRGHP
jgi:hypothetical protein